MDHDDLDARYRELQAYLDWSEDDARRVRAASGLLDPSLAAIVEDFYREIEQHPATRKVITGGQPQIDRLKGTLLSWLRELLSGSDDRDYLIRRWRVGWRHVEIGLDQVFANVALSRVRSRLLSALSEAWAGDEDGLLETTRSLDKRIDLDLAIMGDAYQAEHLERSQRHERLATIGQVAGGVAHELRNPLNVVKTSVYYLLHARSVSDSKRVEHLERIERHVELADGVITALSNFARMPVPESQTVDLAAVLRESVDANPLPPTIALTLECPEDVPRVTADAGQLMIVFGNLIRNARDAMPSGGLLAITAAVSADPRFVETTVTDDGVGISPHDLARVMEPLYTTKARGLGLGLSIARAILDKNHGSLTAASEPGRGSTFTVRLMAEPSAPGHPPQHAGGAST